MRKLVLTVCVAFVAVAAQAQATKAEGWKIISNYNLNFANAAFSTYQAAGGQNNITVAGLIDVNATKPIGKGKWDNALTLAYGANRIGSVVSGAAFRKIDDRILFTSAYTQKLKENWGLTAGGLFRSQFADGFEFPKAGGSNLISTLFSPAYIEIDMGPTYTKPDYTITISPIAYKATIVNNAAIVALAKYIPANKGTNFRSQLGLAVDAKYIKSFAENINFKSKMRLFMDYTTPTKVDVNVEALLNFKVNKFIAVGLGAAYIYDDDIKFNILKADGTPAGYKGTRGQFSNILTVGVTYQLKNYE